MFRCMDIHVCLRACVCVCVCVYIYICIIYIYIHKYMYIYIHIFIYYLYIRCVCVRACVCMCLCIYTHICIYIHMLVDKLECNARVNLINSSNEYTHDLMNIHMCTLSSVWTSPVTHSTHLNAEFHPIFCKRAYKFRALLRKMTYKGKASYDSTPPCQTFDTFELRVA